ncbi:hypothetical protein PIB30_091883 [Stylosanthes scabra]|uniref:Ubiquitin-like protease family profile domain-containing protein n=1 Tax=Stylosanthes scabra TaxID=79078 RepID=A0ABU6TU57_9FABA|nr:hypothetical protein [Stylosanthes scabra]
MGKEKDMSKRCYKWATEDEGNNGYQFLFKFKTGKDYEALRYHFLSMAEKSEVDLAHDILKKYDHNYIDATTGLPYKITTMPNLDTLGYINGNKIKSTPFSNVLDHMQVRAGAKTPFPKMTRNVVSHSLLAKYIPILKLPNEFDCGVYVLKYMEIVNPSLLGKRNFTVPVWTEDELQQFREEFVECLLFDGDNFFRQQALKVSNPVSRHHIPFAALQSLYIRLQSADLESGKLG